MNVRLRQLGELRVDAGGRVSGGEARFVMNHGAGYLYALGAGNHERLLRDLAAELAALEGVAGVWTEAGYAALGLPTPSENAHVGDLLVEAAPRYRFAHRPPSAAIRGPPRHPVTHRQ